MCGTICQWATGQMPNVIWKQRCSSGVHDCLSIQDRLDRGAACRIGCDDRQFFGRDSAHCGRTAHRVANGTFRNRCRANYDESRGAESRADFIHKLRIVEKELNETGIWLRILSKTSLVSATLIVSLLAENTELSKIISASVKTARS